MTDPYLASAGFPPSWDDTIAAIAAGEIFGIQAPPDFPRVYCYLDPSGVSAAFFESADGRRDQTIAVYGAESSEVYGVGAFQIAPGLAHLDVYGDDEQLHTKVLAYVDDPHMYPLYPVDEVGEVAFYRGYQLGAIAVDVNVYDSVEQWEGELSPGDSAAIIGPQFVASAWLFELASNPSAAQEANPITVFKGICKGAELVENSLTGQPWYRVWADCGFDVILALPADTTPAPQVGSVIDGSVLLTGTTGYWLSGQSG